MKTGGVTNLVFTSEVLDLSSHSSSYIMVQWHGSPAATKLRDAFGCVTKISFTDFSSICNDDKENWYKVGISEYDLIEIY